MITTSGSKSNSRCSTDIGSGNSKPRKRKRSDFGDCNENDFKSELNDFLSEDAISIEKKLRKVAEVNSLSDYEMRMLLQKFVKNEHILALVTLKAEDELARERREDEQRAIIITDTPSVAKLTRSKARELNKTPGLALPPVSDVTKQPEIVALIQEDLRSDEEDEEYTFKEEDFISDDDPNATASDVESNPRTPQTPHTNADNDESPVKFSADGCFKIPLEKKNVTEMAAEDLRIAARTRSKLCLEQTTIEDIESEFIPPDVEQTDFSDVDLTTLDADWMQFLNDFSKPLNTNVICDDDDLINDPEYVAADQVPVDAEELRDVNISKKELTELVAELFEGLVNEGLLLQSVDIEASQKKLEQENEVKITENDNQNIKLKESEHETIQNCITDSNITSTNITTPNSGLSTQVTNSDSSTYVTTYANVYPMTTLNMVPEAIGISALDQHNCLPVVKAKGTSGNNTTPKKMENVCTVEHLQFEKITDDSSYKIPYDNNLTSEYISIKKHIFFEYIEKMENLRNLKAVKTLDVFNGISQIITRHQHDVLQQQMRIHVQFLAQNYIQTYSHPVLWKLAPKYKEMLLDLNDKAIVDTSFRATNLKNAVLLIKHWENDLSKDTSENKDMMNFIYEEIDKTNRNSRQIPRFAPRIMDAILNSNVFMYPEYLPRIPFTPKVSSYHLFAPSESQLIAFGLEKHMFHMIDTNERISKKCDPLIIACGRTSKDTVFGKTKRRIWDYVKYLKTTKHYNPIQYFFEHNCAPPVEHKLLPLDKCFLLPQERFIELPLAWQEYLKSKTINEATVLNKSSTLKARTSQSAGTSYLDFAKESLSGIIDISDVITEDESNRFRLKTEENKVSKRHKKLKINPSSLTVNVNYIFGDIINSSANSSCHNPGKLRNSATLNNANHSSIIISESNQQFNQSTVVPSYVDNEQKFCNPPLTSRAKDTVVNVTRKAVRRKTFNLIHRNRRTYIQKYKKTECFSRKFRNLLIAYRKVLQEHQQCYKFSPIVQRYYNSFKTLELYTDLLKDLKMYCRNAASSSLSSASAGSTNSVSTNTGGIGNPALGKRSRAAVTTILLEDETNSTGRSKKISRQEENFRHMLLPDTPEDANRKDAIFAYNFYEKVEEVLKSSKRPEDWKRFNHILKSFNPNRDKVCDLYKKIEQLFLPDQPELAQVFLSFLLPSQAAEIGKFFEHFMIANVVTFINKLNVYFNKQPAQIRKIYSSLNDLAEDPALTVKKVESKILPLLKGNRVLIDWFMQQFPQEAPPERLLPALENVNLKEVLGNQNGDFLEHASNLLDTTTQEHQNGCQLKYINGRIFYGTKITLPAKLFFMASNCQYSNVETENVENKMISCIHGIRDHGEKRLMTAHSPYLEINSGNNEKSEEEETADIVDNNATVDDDYSSSLIEICDDATLRGHAIRLNPNYYSNCCYNSNTISTQTSNSGNCSYSKRTALTSNEDGKISPKKTQAVTSCNSNLVDCLSPNTNILNPHGISAIASAPYRDKRKSPTKKIRSPNSATKSRVHPLPMVIIHKQTSSSITYAKQLKSLIDNVNNDCDSYTKAQIPIVARTKKSLEHLKEQTDGSVLNTSNSNRILKIEVTDEIDFLPDCTAASKTFCTNHETDAHFNNKLKQQVTTHMDNNEDVKLDIIANDNSDATCSNNKISRSAKISNYATSTRTYSSDTAFTREEDKIILIEMKAGSKDLLQRISCKLSNRSLAEIKTRHQFLVDFLSKMQGK